MLALARGPRAAVNAKGGGARTHPLAPPPPAGIAAAPPVQPARSAAGDPLAGLFDGVDAAAPASEPLQLDPGAQATRARALLEDSLQPPPEISLDDERAFRARAFGGRGRIVYPAVAVLIAIGLLLWNGSRPEAPAEPPAPSAPAAAASPPLPPAAASPQPPPSLQPPALAGTPRGEPAAAPSEAERDERAAAATPSSPPSLATATPSSGRAAARATAQPRRTASARQQETSRARKPSDAKPASSRSASAQSDDGLAAERVARAEPAAKPQRARTSGAAELTRQGTEAMLRGDFAAASAAFQQAIEADPRHAPAHRGKGLVLERMNRPKEAARAFKQFLKLSPDAPGADKIRGRLAELEP